MKLKNKIYGEIEIKVWWRKIRQGKKKKTNREKSSEMQI